MSAPCTITSVKGASGPEPGGVNRESAWSRRPATQAAGGRERAILRARRSKPPPRLRALTTSIRTVGIDASHGAFRWAATVWTVQPSHNEGASHASGGSDARPSARRRRSAAMRGKTSTATF